MRTITIGTKSVLLGGLLAVALPASVTPARGGPSQRPSTKKTAAASTGSYDRALLRPDVLKAQAPAEYKVLFSTTRGDFTVTVHRAWAPVGADRFYNLVRHHYYDNASFFRVLPGFVVQFGISAYPAVNKVWSKATIKDDSVTQSNRRGYITYAASPHPNTRTTQVFINLADNQRLDGSGFAPFGEVDGQGMKVVEMMYEGYGEGAPQGAGPDQEQMQIKGKPYLDKGWPKLDYVKTARLVATAPTGAPKATTKPVSPTKKQP